MASSEVTRQEVRKTETHTDCLAGELRHSDATAALRSYDLSGFPGIGDVSEDIAKRLDGLNYQSLDISDNPEECVQLEYFYQRFVRPEALTRTEGELTRRYAGVAFSALGEQGSLLHIRRIEAGRDLPPDSPLNTLVIIGHLDDPHLASFQYAMNRLERNIDATTETIYTVTPLGPPTELQSVGERSEADVLIDRLRSSQRKIDLNPVIALRNTTKLYRRSDGHWEGLNDMARMRERVRIGIVRKYGESALVSCDDSVRQMTERLAS